MKLISALQARLMMVQFKSPSLRFQDVRYYLHSRQNFQVKAKPKNYNSFVNPKAGFEFEADVMDILARDGGDGIRYGLCAIDNFTKVLKVIPIKNKQPAELVRVLKLIRQPMGKPKQLYSDEEPNSRS